jgi:hypothetical protein
MYRCAKGIILTSSMAKLLAFAVVRFLKNLLQV